MKPKFMSEARYASLVRKLAELAAKKKFPFSSRGAGQKCFACKEEVETEACDHESKCWYSHPLLPKRHWHLWTTTKSDWKKIPLRYRKKILCKRCFAALAK